MTKRSSQRKQPAKLDTMTRLFEAFDWFERGFQNSLTAHGIRSHNKTQSMVMLYISAGIHRPIEMAKRLRISRQAIRQASNQLAEMGMIDIIDDEHDKRGRRLVFKKEFESTRQTALGIIGDLEQELCSRIGAENVEQLIDILGMDWGEVVTSEDAEN